MQRPRSALCWFDRTGALLQVVRDPRTKRVGLVQVDLAGDHASMLFELDKRWVEPSFGVEAAPDGDAVYLLLQAAAHPPELWQVARDPASDIHTPRRLLSLSPTLTEVALGTSRLVEWTALDGTRLCGALLLPPNYSEGTAVPLIIDLYGGSFLSNLLHVFGGDETIMHGQLLAARGFAVLYPDLPLEPRDPLRQLPGKVLPAIDRLVELGIADADRLGLMGHSYGGYCVLALLTQTRRFRAALASAAAVNLTSLYGALTEGGDSQWLGWAEGDQGRLGGSLWERREAYIENSPLFSLDRVTTPVLLVSGTAWPWDAQQAGEAFSALRRLGTRVELRLYDGEGHVPVLWSEQSFRDLHQRVLCWFETHLLRRTF